MILELDNINKSYSSGSKEREVLSNLSLKVGLTDSIAITGPSGSGKSTLLNILGTIDNAYYGNYFFKGETISNFKQDELTQIRSEEIAFIFQSHHLLPQLNLLENVLLPTLPVKDKQTKNRRKERALKLLKQVGIYEYKDQFPSELSGGEQQRAALVRALVNEPGLILADEPTGSLDETNSNNIAELLLSLQKEYELALILVTHDMDLASKMDKHFELRNGSLHQRK
jgi:ABC-type lipoprotein export system ATPase subunit